MYSVRVPGWKVIATAFTLIMVQGCGLPFGLGSGSNSAIKEFEVRRLEGGEQNSPPRATVSPVGNQVRFDAVVSTQQSMPTGAFRVAAEKAGGRRITILVTTEPKEGGLDAIFWWQVVGSTGSVSAGDYTVSVVHRQFRLDGSLLSEDTIASVPVPID